MNRHLEDDHERLIRDSLCLGGRPDRDLLAEVARLPADGESQLERAS